MRCEWIELRPDREETEEAENIDYNGRRLRPHAMQRGPVRQRNAVYAMLKRQLKFGEKMKVT